MLCGRKAGAACLMETSEEGPIQEGLNFKRKDWFCCLWWNFRVVVSFLFKVKLFPKMSVWFNHAKLKKAEHEYLSAY